MNQRDAVDQLVDSVGVVKASGARMVAGVLFTYRCSIACKHCCFGCEQARPDVVMTPAQCVRALRLLHETGRVVHIAGGEAMLYWNEFAESFRLAAKEGVSPQFLETNCSFAVSDDLTRDRLTFMAEHGMRGILASLDPFHQEFVPVERFLRVRRLAIELFGEKNFYGSMADAGTLTELESLTRDEARLREHVRRYPPIAVGTAQKRLAPYLDQFAPDDPNLPWKGWRDPVERGSCASQFKADRLWELHIDPYDNIQTNCGMILGTIRETTPARLLAAGPEKANRFVQTVCESGPLGLARLAEREFGFVLPERVSQNCELCYLARRFLRRHEPSIFGPAEIY